MNKVLTLSLLIAVLLGCLTAWIDSRPNWDDTGISCCIFRLPGKESPGAEIIQDYFFLISYSEIQSTFNI